MKRFIIAILLTAVFCLALTCSNASIREETGRDEWLAYYIPEREAVILEKSEVDRLIASQAESSTNIELVSAEAPPVFQLPASLKFIEDEAFEGTAIVVVDLPETVESIGENAFANIPTLRSIRIPDATKQIAKTAFAGSSNVTITAAPGSYARAWARENDVSFVPLTVMYAGTGSVQFSASTGNRHEQIDADVYGPAGGTEKRPQWRPLNEINTERYADHIANHISGRSPPAWA